MEGYERLEAIKWKDEIEDERETEGNRRNICISRNWEGIERLEWTKGIEEIE